MGFSTTTMPDGREIPLIYGHNVQVHIDRKDMNIKIHGNMLANAINIITPYIQGTVSGLVETALLKTIGETVPQVVNQDLQETDGFLHMDYVPTWWLDWETPAPFKVSEDSITFSTKGVMFDTEFGEEDSGVTIPDLPDYDSNRSQKCQNYVSMYSLNTIT